MTPTQSSAPVMQLRVALTTRDHARLVRLYSAGLGLEPAQVWANGDDRGLMLEMGRATLEIFDEGYARHVDELEAGSAISGQVRLAIQVPDLKAAIQLPLDDHRSQRSSVIGGCNRSSAGVHGLCRW